jgi:hypothetical protein
LEKFKDGDSSGFIRFVSDKIDLQKVKDAIKSQNLNDFKSLISLLPFSSLWAIDSGEELGVFQERDVEIFIKDVKPYYKVTFITT